MGSMTTQEPKINMDQVVWDKEYEEWEKHLRSKYGRTKDEQFEKLAIEYFDKANKAKKYKDPLNMFEEDKNEENKDC